MFEILNSHSLKEIKKLEDLWFLREAFIFKILKLGRQNTLLLVCFLERYLEIIKIPGLCSYYTTYLMVQVYNK